ncbi:PD-(D/E)XK nuclease-like domain-containing protein [Levilactobacillus bambusae]|uniref:PD-(D/E)XK nuclease-like domain-containing protein n=1 Tax=Levilactobacillus bambusae TaxID=2024736 RepID=UPI0027956577|nr:PD-(D/E)XK nuclease-like domain-containing protein [Levilactobacillus bambusae]
MTKLTTTKNQNKKNSSTTSATLTTENYYSLESDRVWQSKTRFREFEDCEAAALAQLEGRWNPDSNVEVLLVGNYLHSYFESKEAHQRFLEENSKAIYKYGKPEKGIKSSFRQADSMIDALEADANFNRLYQGEKEVVVKGELYGVQWKGKIDCLNLDRGMFMDLKTVDDIHKKHWDVDSHQYVSFPLDRSYDLQMAIYRELIHQQFDVWCDPYIIAVSKQVVPDKGIYSIPDYLMQERLGQVEMDQPRIESVIHHEEEPIRCEHCDYCRLTKTLDEVIPIDEIELY